MTRKFKVGDKVSYPMNGAIKTGKVMFVCGAPNNEHGTCYSILPDVGASLHKRAAFLTLVTPQNLDSLAKTVDDALDRLEQVEGRVDKLEQAGGTPLVEYATKDAQAAQNLYRKFKVVNAVTLQGKEGLVVDAGRDTYRVQIPGWGTLMYLGEDLERVEPVTLAQAWAEGARHGFEDYVGKFDATIDNVLVSNPYEEDK